MGSSNNHGLSLSIMTGGQTNWTISPRSSGSSPLCQSVLTINSGAVCFPASLLCPPLPPPLIHCPAPFSSSKLQCKKWHVTADHYWWADEPDSENHFHPHERAPRCLPCHWTKEDEDRSFRADGYQPFVGLPACPCTAEHICRHDARGFFDESCNMPVHPHRAYR